MDDVHCAGPTATLNGLIDKLIPQHCEIQAGPLEIEGVAVEVLGRTKTRLRGAILTAPNPKHAQNIVRAVAISPTAKSQVPSRKADLSKTELLNAERAARYRSAVGSGIYLSADRRDIAYSVKELARHMSAPRECDWECIEILAKYLQAKPDYVRVTALDADAYEGDLSLDVYSDSDWAGRPETRRSTDSHVAYVGGAIIAATTQTQPGLPATSSPDAELRGISRATREALFTHGLANEDFGLQTSIPWLWTDSSTALTAAKRIGPGSKLRHLEVSEFYVQGAGQAGKIQVRKVKGTTNPGNYLTKHPKSGSDVLDALPSLGIVNVHDIAGASAVTRGTVKAIQVNDPSRWQGYRSGGWHLQLIGGILASQILGIEEKGAHMISNGGTVSFGSSFSVWHQPFSWHHDVKQQQISAKPSVK